MSLRDQFLKGKVSEEYAEVTDSALDINVKERTSPSLDTFFVQVANPPTTLSVATAIDDTTLTLTSVTNFVNGTYVAIVTPAGRATFVTQIGDPAGSVITIDSPMDFVYPIGTVVLNLTRELAVDGDTTPQVFQVGPSELALDITNIVGYMQDGNSMSDGKFGSLDPLVKGCVFRLTDGVVRNKWNVKTNNDIALLGSLEYPAKVPAEDYSCRFQIPYGGPDRHGVVLHLEAGSILQFIIQDDLGELTTFRLMAQGHEVL